MFTGLVAGLGRVVHVDRSPDGATLTIETPLAGELRKGDSVAVNGICLTAIERHDGSFGAEAMNETLARTSLGGALPGVEVNLELPMRAGDPFGGHFVQGHVDGVGTVLAATDDGFARRVQIEPPLELLRYIVHKGSIAVDGVSLTVADVDDSSFTVSLIPETLERTNLGRAEPSMKVNLEVDILAKYVERALRERPRS